MKAKKVWISNALLFVILLIFAFLFSCQKEYTPPDKAWHAEQKIFRLKAPSEFTTLVGWGQVATIKNKACNKAKITIEYMKLIESLPNLTDKIVYERYFGTPLTSEEGGLFERDFSNDDHAQISAISQNEQGLLEIDASKTPSKMIHWYTTRVELNKDAIYFVEIRCKIQGQIGLQLGIDVWKGHGTPHNGWDKHCEGKNNCEIMVSDWYYETEKDEFITIRAPKIYKPFEPIYKK